MRLYRTADHRWAGTQAEAGKGHVQVEVPTDKQGLLDWLNHSFLSPTSPGLPAPAAEAPAAAPAVQPPASNRCPRCNATPEGAAKLAEGMNADAFAERVLESPRWFVARVFEALAERMSGGTA